MPTTTNVVTTVTKSNGNKPSRRSAKKAKQPSMFSVQGAPVSKSIRMKKKNPSIKNSANGTTIVVSHTEFVSDIISSGSAYAVTRYAINPGLSASFPWLAALANNYESYKFKSLEYHYKPICATTTPGKVIVAIDFDAADSNPTSKLILNSYEGAVSSSPWDLITYKATPKNLNKFGVQRFVRGGAIPTSTDIKTYDIGAVFVGTSNTPSTSTTLGELYVSYTVEFYTPQLPVPIALSPGSGESQSFGLQDGTITVVANGVASLNAIYYNQLLYYIVQQRAEGGFTYIDLAINPFIRKPIRFDLSAPSNSLIGRPNDIPVNSIALDYITSIVNVQSNANNFYNRSWVTRPYRAYDQTNNIGQLSVYRLQVPISAGVDPTSIKLIASTLEGYPNGATSGLVGIGPATFTAPLISNINFNWNNPTQLSNQIFRSFTELTDDSSTENDDSNDC